jgi:acylphosphatase
MSSPQQRPRERERLEAAVHGRVQGVGFRFFLRQEATRLGLSGWVSNEPDGSVRVVAEGSTPALEEFARLLADGPSGAHVERVDARWGDARGDLRAFGVRAGRHPGD